MSEQDPLPFGEASHACPIKNSILFTLSSCHIFPLCTQLVTVYWNRESFWAKTTRSLYTCK